MHQPNILIYLVNHLLWRRRNFIALALLPLFFCGALLLLGLETDMPGEVVNTRELDRAEQRECNTGTRTSHHQPNTQNIFPPRK